MIFQYFSRHIEFSKTLQDSPVYLSTFQACANLGVCTFCNTPLSIEVGLASFSLPQYSKASYAYELGLEVEGPERSTTNSSHMRRNGINS